MKLAALLLASLFLTACQVNGDGRSVQAPEISAVSEKASSSSNQYNYAKVIIDEETQRIEVTRGILSGEGSLTSAEGVVTRFTCGLTLESGSVIDYHLVDSDTLELTIDGEPLEFKRIHHSHGDATIYGDWVHTAIEPNATKSWTFFIRDNGILNVDSDCYHRFE
jgi:hypothetical protein